MELKLFTLRYKAGIRGVQSGYVKASSIEKAEELGRKWVGAHPGYIFIGIEDPVLISEEVIEKKSK